MKKCIGLLVVLSVLFAGLYGPPVAYCFEESLYFFQTVDDPAVPYEPGVLEDAPFWQANWDATNPPPWIVPLGASLWAVETRASDGKLVKSKLRRIGTGTAVAMITDPMFPEFSGETLAPFYFDAALGDLKFKANGYAIVTNNLLTELGVVLVSCDLQVYSDPEIGILSGNATSNSVFNLGNPDFHTGSFWTLRLFLK